MKNTNVNADRVYAIALQSGNCLQIVKKKLFANLRDQGETLATKEDGKIQNQLKRTIVSSKKFLRHALDIPLKVGLSMLQ